MKQFIIKCYLNGKQAKQLHGIGRGTRFMLMANSYSGTGLSMTTISWPVTMYPIPTTHGIGDLYQKNI